ncbi:uncharacterized protein H6S33_007081 [Morchella sextelata]|uniref:uncharacterized protein n=1 Tax=Morchella sextelata TaxID=1174677 RepID=UPI001D0563CF|nr:uncharacterized protein H6S33_007081 [Morchella sextelata]KAH0604050.1 hypothetical protein H6S33_007081 [Morchella sextelata]
MAQYNHISSDFVTRCFYGTYKTSSENKPTRPSPSTIPGAQNVEVLSINNNPEEMVRYKSVEDDGYRKVSACIQLMVADAPGVISIRWERWNRLRDAESDGVQVTFDIPFEPEYLRNRHFTGRTSILDEMHLAIAKAHASSDLAFVILIGLGGTGKTQIASEYTYLHQQDYQSIFWVNAATKQSAETGFVVIAQRLVREYARILTGRPTTYL